MTRSGLCRIMCFRQATRNSYRFEERTTNNQQRRRLIRVASVSRSTVLRDVASWKYRTCDGGRATDSESVVRSGAPAADLKMQISATFSRLAAAERDKPKSCLTVNLA